MTPADLARQNAIAFECKKDSLRQTQAGTWKVAFTVIDMDERLTRAMPGTRYQAVLVEVGDDELPVQQPAKESKSTPPTTPQPGLDKPRAGAKRDWHDLSPQQQAGIRCEEAAFIVFLEEKCEPALADGFTAANAVRSICGVKSRSELGTNHKARMLWHALDSEYQAWLLKERVGA